MFAEREQVSSLLVFGNFDGRIAVFVNDAPWRQVAIFAVCDVSFAVGNHARREVYEERTLIASGDTDGDRVRAEGSFRAAEGENAAAALRAATDGNNADTSCRCGFFGVFTDSADMPSPSERCETVSRLLRLLNHTPNCPPRGIVSEAALSINVQYVLSFAQHLRFRRWDNAAALNPVQIRRDTQHAV